MKDRDAAYLIVALVASLGLVLPYATISQALEPAGPAVFGGTRLLLGSFSGWTLSLENILKALLWLLHLPTCLVSDTLLLPVSIINEIRRGGVKVDPLNPFD